MTYRAKRRIVRISLFVLLFVIPFLKINGNPVLRFDIKEMSIYVLGVSLTPSHIFPAVLIIFACLFFFIFATQLFGRLWCGWLCPQTNWLEMASDISFTISKKDSKAVVKVKKGFNIFMKLVVSVLFTVVLALYFVVPQDLISIWHIIAIVALILFLEITFVGRLFCKTVCPYSNFQSVMYDADTMRVALLPDRADACINCKACVRVCPTGLDIREGLSNKCVLCASCVDACTEIMAKLGKKTCVDYMFGRQRLNLFTPNKIITFILAVLFLLAGLISF